MLSINNKFLAISGVILILLAAVFMPATAKAALIPGVGEIVGELGEMIVSEVGSGIMSILGKALGFVIYAINTLIGFIASIIFTIGSLWISAGLVMNQGLLSSELVRIGFKIILDMANLGFVLAIIIIAFATILRIPSYEMKQLLWKLIAAAILVNFSLTIAGVFLDFSGMLTQFFINKGSMGGGGMINQTVNFVSNLAGHTGVQNLLEVSPTADLIGITDFGSNTFKAIASVFFVGMFTMTAAVVFLIIAVMIFIRYVYLTILLILMPIAWLMWLFPNLSYLWTKWWSKFFHWIFFLPTLTFFLYLTVRIIEAPNLFANLNAIGQHQAGVIGAMGLSIANLWQTVGKMLAVLGLMGAGAVVANVAGLEGGRAIMKAGDAVKGWAIGAVGKVAKAPAQRPAKATARGLSNLLLNPALRWIPGAKGAANRLAGFGSRQPEVDDYAKKNFGSLTDDQFEGYTKTLPAGLIARAAVLKEAAGRKMLGKFKEGQLKELAAVAQQTNPGVKPQAIPTIKEILGVDPSLAPTLTGQSVNEVVDKMSPDKVVENLDGKYLDAHPEVVLALNRSSIAAIKRRGSDAQNEAVRRRLETAAGDPLKNINIAMAATRKKLKEAKEIGDEAESEKLKSQLRVFIDTLRTEKGRATREQISAYDKLTIVNQTIGEPLT